jgi:TonB family protein
MPVRYSIRSSIVAALVLGCASSQSPVTPYALFLKPWSPPPGQTCEIPPARLVNLDRVMDTVAARRSLPSFPAGAVVLGGVLPDTLRVLESTVPDSVAARLRHLLLTHVRFSEVPRFFVRVDLGPLARIRLSPGLDCMTAPRDPDVARQASGRYRQAGISGPRVVHLGIDTAGNVRQASIRRSSGNAEVDEGLLAWTRQIKFWPGLMNRFPIWVSFDWPMPSGNE